MDKLLTTDDICQHFQVTDRTVYNWRKNTSNPFPKPIFIGGGNKYKQSEVEAYIESLSQKAA
jgi:predicted DNA-binding transcriptional regulator AlpA